MAKATTHPTCKPTNLNIRTRSSTLYANAPILLASILLNFRRRPESHLQLQVSEKSGVGSQESGVDSGENRSPTKKLVGALLAAPGGVRDASGSRKRLPSRANAAGPG